MRTIQVDRDIYDFIASKAREAGEAPSAILRRVLPLPQPMEAIEIDDDTYNFIISKTATVGESASDILRRELQLVQDPHEPHEPHEPGPRTVVFRSPANTGPSAWNTREATIDAFVGDTLRLFNDDTAPHQVHTTGSPFPHPVVPIPPGELADFVLASPFEPDQRGPLYDHTFGLTAQFWIRVRAR